MKRLLTFAVLTVTIILPALAQQANDIPPGNYKLIAYGPDQGKLQPFPIPPESSPLTVEPNRISVATLDVFGAKGYRTIKLSISSSTKRFIDLDFDVVNTLPALKHDDTYKSTFRFQYIGTSYTLVAVQPDDPRQATNYFVFEMVTRR